jgi:hypothetical protein
MLAMLNLRGTLVDINGQREDIQYIVCSNKEDGNFSFQEEKQIKKRVNNNGFIKL